MSAIFFQLKYFQVQVGLGCGRVEIHNSENSSLALVLRVLLMLYYPLGRVLTHPETCVRLSLFFYTFTSESWWVFTVMQRANLGQNTDAIFNVVKSPHSFQMCHPKDEIFKSNFRSKNMHECVGTCLSSWHKGGRSRSIILPELHSEAASQ